MPIPMGKTYLPFLRRLLEEEFAVEFGLADGDGGEQHVYATRGITHFVEWPKGEDCSIDALSYIARRLGINRGQLFDKMVEVGDTYRSSQPIHLFPAIEAALVEGQEDA